MRLRLRQIALVASDLEPVVADLAGTFCLDVCYRDPALRRLGLHNALLPVGDEFLEVVSPIVDGTSAGRYLERRGGDGGYMVITQTADHRSRRARFAELGIRIVGDFSEAGFVNTQLHPADTGGSFLEVDEQRDGGPGGRWSPAGADWRDHVRTDVVTAITGVEIQSPDHRRVADRWSEIVEIPVSLEGATPTIALDNAIIRFVDATDGRGEGLGGIELAVVDGERIRAAADTRGLAITNDVVLIGGLRCYLR